LAHQPDGLDDQERTPARQPVLVDANLDVWSLARWVDAEAGGFAHLARMSAATDTG